MVVATSSTIPAIEDFSKDTLGRYGNFKLNYYRGFKIYPYSSISIRTIFHYFLNIKLLVAVELFSVTVEFVENLKMIKKNVLY